MTKPTKENWTCVNCKFNKVTVTPDKKIITMVKTPKLEKNAIVSDKTFNAVVESVNFTSDQFGSFGQQLKELILSIKELKIEN
jgi:hypothetical protein